MPLDNIFDIASITCISCPVFDALLDKVESFGHSMLNQVHKAPTVPYTYYINTNTIISTIIRAYRIISICDTNKSMMVKKVVLIN